MKIDPRMRYAGRQLKTAKKGSVLVIPMEDLDAMLRLLHVVKRQSDFSLFILRPGMDAEDFAKRCRPALECLAA